MSELPTAFVEIGQGALTARALEPDAGGTTPGHTHESACLNCGTRLVGSHCHGCGQAAHVHRTIGAFFHDLAHGVFHVEGKVWRTLPLLAWHPGRLTRQYIDGRRASYVSPIALFLFAVFVLFAAIHLVEGGDRTARIYTSTHQAADAQEQVLAKLRKQRAAARTPADVAAIDRRIASVNATIASIGAIRIVDDAADANGNDQDWRRDLPRTAHAVDAFRANPDLAIYKLQSTAYKYSWLLIPLSVPMLWLLFPFNRRFQLYDHTVFVTYSLTFMTLLAVVTMLGSAAGIPFAGLLLLLVPPVHMYRQLHGTYATGVAGTLWRTAVLCGFACVALFGFMLLLFSVELSG